MKSNSFVREEEARRFLHQYIESVKSANRRVLWSSHEIHEGFREHFRDRFDPLAWSSASGVSPQSRQTPSPSVGENNWLQSFGYRVQSPWYIEAGRPQQVSRTGWFALWSVLEDVTYVCAYSDGCVQPLVCSGSHPYQHYQRSDHIAEERQACLGGIRRLQAHNSAEHWVKNFGPDLGEQFAGYCHGFYQT